MSLIPTWPFVMMAGPRIRRNHREQGIKLAGGECVYRLPISQTETGPQNGRMESPTR